MKKWAPDPGTKWAHWIMTRVTEMEHPIQYTAERARVFCDMAPEPDLWPIIQEHPTIDWIVLADEDAHAWNVFIDKAPENWANNLPENIIIAVRLKTAADETKIADFFQIPGRRLLLCEPYEQLNLRRYLGILPGYRNCGSDHLAKEGWAYDDYTGGFSSRTQRSSTYDPRPGIHWIVLRGEIGDTARPLHPDWVRKIRDACEQTGTPLFFDGWGEWSPDCICGRKERCATIPRPQPGSMGIMFRCGSAHSGRRLQSGELWLQEPLPKEGGDE